MAANHVPPQYHQTSMNIQDNNINLPTVGKLYRIKTGSWGPGAGSVVLMINVSHADSSEPGKFLVRVKFLATCLEEAKVYDIRFGWGENWYDFLEPAETWNITQT